MILGLSLGVPLGYWFILAWGSQPVFQFMFGLSLAGFALHELIKPRLRKPLAGYLGFPAGVVGGFLGGAFTTSGPPVGYLFVFPKRKSWPL